MTPRRTPSKHPAPRRRRRWWFIALGAVTLCVVIAFALAQPIARWQTRKWLRALHGVQGEFLDARFSFFPLGYSVQHLKLSQPERQTQEPLLYAEELSLQLAWGDLLTGRLVARMRARGVKVVLEQPKPGTPSRLPELSKHIPLPVLLERLQVQQGEVLYVWVHQKGRPSMWFHDIEATLEHVGSRPDLALGPMTLAATGVVQRSGKMSVVVLAEPYATPLTFHGEASLEDFDVSQMNALIDSQKGVKLSPGVFSLKMSFDSKAGNLSGQVDPHLRDTVVVEQDAKLASALKVLLAHVTMALTAQPEGTTASGAILVHDELTQEGRQLLPGMEKVVENGFLLGLQESLRRVYAGAPTAPSPKGKATELHAGD